MRGDRELKRELNDIKRGVKGAARQARRRSGAKRSDAVTVNVSTRTNFVAARNVGAEGSVEEISGTQDTGPIRQINPGS